MYVVQLKKGVYLTDKLTPTNDLQMAMIISNYEIAKLYLQGQYERVKYVYLENDKIKLVE
jgi:hypothetical protein